SLGSNIEIWAEGLYTKRHTDSLVSYGSLIPGYYFTDNAVVTQYGVSGGANAELGSDWHFSLGGDYSRSLTNDPEETFIGATPSSTTAQHFRTRFDDVDAQLTGPITELP